MARLIIKFNRMRLEEKFLEKLDREGNVSFEIRNSTTLQNLLDNLEIEKVGKLVMINGKAVTDFNTRLCDNDYLEIYQLVAGG